MSDAVLKHPQLIFPYLKEMVNLLTEDKPDAIIRNILRILQNIDLPEKHSGIAFENAFNLMMNPKSAIAIQAFSITTVTRICKQYPDLRHEVGQAIDIIMENAERPAILVRCRDARKELQRMD